jgi:preprotein translocase subunit SecF
MQIITKQTNIDFLGKRGLFVPLSLLLVAGSLFLWFDRGDTKFGVDFRGGYEYVVKYGEDVPLKSLRDKLGSSGFSDALVQNFEGGSREFSIRLKGDGDPEHGKRVKKVLGELGSNELLKEDFVGPVIGEQIKRDGIRAFIIGLVGIFIYVTIQFNWSWGVAALVALLHDAVVATGATILMGIELSGATLAAVLTIAGYSVNDTIIIFDRMRENLRERDRGGSAGKKGISERMKNMNQMEIINFSINQTLARTVITTLTVVLVCLALWLLGNTSVSDLAFTLFVGVVVGTYSTIFVCGPVIMLFSRERPKKS